MIAIWIQNYDPLQNQVLSTLAAAFPILLLFACIGLFRLRILPSAVFSLIAAFGVAILINRMPAPSALASALYGVAYGLFPIGWILLNVVFLYQLAVRRGHMDILRQSLASLAPDPRIQIILIAFAFGSFLEGMAGFGAPMAITSALLLQMGFRPLDAASLSLLGITASVAFGSLGIPVTTLEQVTGLNGLHLSAVVGRQLPFFSIIMPFWLVAFFGGLRALRGVWPVALVAGLGLAIPQFVMANYHGPWLVDIVSGAICLISVAVFCQFWAPRTSWDHEGSETDLKAGPAGSAFRPGMFTAWMPWIILTVIVFIWGMPAFVRYCDSLLVIKIPVPFLDGLVQRVPPIVPEGARPEAAVFKLNILSASGTGILLAAVISGWVMRFRLREMAGVYFATFHHLRHSLLIIGLMLAIGHVVKFSGCDAMLGLALALTGGLYPFFGTLLGWVGVTVTGSDTSTNVLFGNLQKITAQQIGLDPYLMCAAGTTGGVMGKAIAAQSLVVTATATNQSGAEGDIFRRIFPHTLALACLMGGLVFLQAYVWPFTAMVRITP
jgi:lactate permease